MTEWGDPLTDAFKRIDALYKKSKVCANCGDPLKTYWIISKTKFVCRKCYDEWNAILEEAERQLGTHSVITQCIGDEPI